MSVKGTKRKTSAEFTEEHELFIELIKERKPELEIMQELALSRVQLQAHLFQVLKRNEIAPADLNPAYEVVKAKSLPEAIRQYLSLDAVEGAEMLVKVEAEDEGVFLTPLPLPHTDRTAETGEQPTTRGRKEKGSR